MADLKYILDVDDEDPGVNKTVEPNPPNPSPGHDPSRTAPKSHDSPRHPDDSLIPAPARRRGPLSRSTKYTAPVASTSPPPGPTSSSAPIHLPPVRRHSTESLESMDHPAGYGGHGHGQRSSSSRIAPSGRSNALVRPVSNAPESNLPVKLTPITGRVSRAKKGVPVHTCEICRPPKTFTRAEHLRRHQLSHGNPRYQCTHPGCDKAFHRPDLLARHAQRHEQDEKSVRGGAPHSPTTSPAGGVGVYGSHMDGSSGGPNAVSGRASNPSSAYADSPYALPDGSSGRPPMSPPQPGGRHGSPSGYVLTSQPGPMPLGTPYGLSPFPEPRTSPPFPVYMASQALQDLPSLTIPDTNVVPGLVATHDWPSSASDSQFSTPSDAGGMKTVASGYASSDWPPSMYPSGTSQSPASIDLVTTSAPMYPGPYSPSPQHSFDPMLEMSMYAQETTGFFDPSSAPYSPVRSPTPPTIPLSAQSAEILVTHAVPAYTAEPALVARSKDSAAVLASCPGAAFPRVGSLRRPLQNALPEYLEVYWKRFDPLFPFVHRRSVESAAGEVLRCAMAAIATQYLPSKEARDHGKELHDFARKEVQSCSQWDVQVMQTISLNDYYARFRGQKAEPRRSDVFQSLYSRVANLQLQDQRPSITAGGEDNWTRWIHEESQRRLLAVCFVHDVHTSLYHQHSFTHPFPSSIPPIPLSRSSEALWTARTLEEWEAAAFAPHSTALEPVTLPDAMLTLEELADLPPLDYSVFLNWEARCLPRPAMAGPVDLSLDVDTTPTTRISYLFSQDPVANTYLALNYTPLRELLMVSGESWVFARKEQDPAVFEQKQKYLRQWSNSQQAGAAAGFAAKALLAYLDTNDDSTVKSKHTKAKEPRDRSWNTTLPSDYWAVYVCALICWALNHPVKNPAMRGSGPPTSHTTNAGTGKAEREAKAWLRMMASQSPKEALNVKGRREATAVVSMVRRRLEGEGVERRCTSKLLVESVNALRKLEEGAHRRWF
ncbi:hypothetical protein F4780DRAFT_109146 [Xylariomycetidae sp. FL0641]|nr:hypothetical protein F4780DRAFT_109146 [Xylariomycetidae sp. FL0641]